MRKLYPVDEEKLNTLQKLESFKLTEEQYKALLDAIDNLNTKITENEDDLDDYKEALKGTISSLIGNFTSTNIESAKIAEAIIDTLSSTDFSSETSTIDNLTVNTIATIERVRSTLIQADEASISKIDSDYITTKNLDVDTISTNTIEADEYNVSNLTSDNAVIDSATISEANIAEQNTAHANITDLISDNAKIEEAEIEDLKAAVSNLNKFSYEFAYNDKDIYQDLDEYATGTAGDYWIVLPKFTNGTYYLQAKDNENTKIWSMEIDNSTRNIMFCWSVNDTYPWIKDIELVESEGIEFIQIHCQTNHVSTKLYHRCDSFDNEVVPSIYSTKQYDGTKDFVVESAKGIWMPNAVFAGEFHADTLEIDNVEFDNISVNHTITLPNDFDQYGDPIGYTTGGVGAYITNVEDEFGNTNVMWQSPADSVERDDEHLITSKAVSEYDGKVQTGEDDDGNPIYEYPIKHLNEDTTAYGDLTVKKDLTVEGNSKLRNFYNGAEADFIASEYGDNSLVIFTEVNDDSDYKSNTLYRYRIGESLETILEEIIASTDKEDQKVVIYDKETNSYKTTDELAIRNILADNIVVDDLTVNGTAHINNTEEEQVVGDFLALRANNNAGLTSGQYSGILVNNYKEGEICAIVVDHNGIARVGHATSTSTTYDDLYYKDNKYYTDAELTNEVEPEGVMLSWSSKETTDGIEHWTDAVWYVLSFDSTQALLTREESVDMNDQGIIKWNADTNKSDTLDLPTKSEQTLTSVVESSSEVTTTVYKIGDKFYDAEMNEVSEPEGTIQSSTNLLDSGAMGINVYDDGSIFEDRGEGVYLRVTSFNPYTTEPDDPAVEAEEIGTSDELLEVVYVQVTEGKITYLWQDKQAGILHFATMEEYEEYEENNNVPVDTLIVIDEEETNVFGEDK